MRLRSQQDTPSDSQVEWRDVAEPDLSLPQLSVTKFLEHVRVHSVHLADSALTVFFERTAFNQMLRDCNLDRKREHAGILVGNAFRYDNNSSYVVVRQTVLAPATLGTGVNVNFTTRSWEALWRSIEWDRDRRVVGWYHTHPGLGVFLSGTDLRTQSAFFPNPWQLAVVVDPVKKPNEVGFFAGKNGDRVGQVLYIASARGVDAYDTDTSQESERI